MQKLQSRNEIIITEGNKGGAVVILDVYYYVKKAERQFNNKENYKSVNYDPPTANNETIYKFTLRFQKENFLSKNISEERKNKIPRHHIFT